MLPQLRRRTERAAGIHMALTLWPRSAEHLDFVAAEMKE
jgi:hypothetical protein